MTGASPRKSRSEVPLYSDFYLWSGVFGTPHRGAKAVELGKIAVRVVRFVSKEHASDDLDCLEGNSHFTRQMADRFCHQLEDYRVVSFIEGREVQLGVAGPASISHVSYGLSFDYISRSSDDYLEKLALTIGRRGRVSCAWVVRAS